MGIQEYLVMQYFLAGLFITFDIKFFKKKHNSNITGGNTKLLN